MIFARRPQRGRVKTRLVPPLTPSAALSLHVACLKSVARLGLRLPPSVGKWLYLTSPTQAQARRVARWLGLPRQLIVRTQRGRDLGARLRRALRELLTAGYERVVFIGTDSPTLTPRRLQQAFKALSAADAVIGPARDGGYYLVGARALPSSAAEEMFRGIEWGTARTLQQTARRLKKLKRRVRLLPLGYDVDTVADLTRLERELQRNFQPHLAPLRAWFRSRADANHAFGNRV